MINLQDYQLPSNDYDHLSLKDLLDAQDLYHVHLMRQPNVVATALSRYRIRREDSWPDEHGAGKRHGTGVRTLENSEVRPYSWPCVLVLVERWVPESEFGGGEYKPDEIIPKTLYLPDGRRVPVCVVQAPREQVSPPAPPVRFPLNNIGGGRPILARVQGQEHFATIACLVRDGHKVYGLTNRHVTGDAGEVLFTRRGGRVERIGMSADKQLTRIPFMDLYPGFIRKDAYVNLDIGLVDMDDLGDWTAKVEGIGTIGPLADLSVQNLSLALVGCHVRGYGSASGLMQAEIHGLFYRYKSQGGFDYIADFFFGPRSSHASRRTRSNGHARKAAVDQPGFVTQPGDSGTLWLLEPRTHEEQKAVSGHADGKSGTADEAAPFLPLAVQWGAHLLRSDGTEPQSYALATCLSTVCNLLDVDLVRDWNLDQPDTWGAVGHFSIASRVTAQLSTRNPKLVQLMTNSAPLIAPDDQTIRSDAFKGMGSQAFVHLADVPDFFWKHGRQGHSRPFEGPNHFADMDQPNDAHESLLTLCKDPDNIDPGIWNEFYDTVRDLLTGEKISQKNRGLLPFRVWQIFDEMVRFARAGKGPEFVCAAGVLTHYLGDACQPLHISYLHDGDPLQPTSRTVHHQNGTVETVHEPLGKGVHAGYEDDMVNTHRKEILDGLDKGAKRVTKDELIDDGFTAARMTIDLMRETFKLLPPSSIVDAYVQNLASSKKDRAEALWKKFGPRTIKAMQASTHLLALLWESAWTEGAGEDNVHSTKALTEDAAMAICADRDFLPSMSVATIGTKLSRPASHATA